jgi:hypothetical protein
MRCVSPTVSITGIRGSSQTAFQLIPATAMPINREIHAMRCGSLCIGKNPPPIQQSIAHSFPLSRLAKTTAPAATAVTTASTVPSSASKRQTLLTAGRIEISTARSTATRIKTPSL